jgi:hypothetical protein
MPEQEEARRKRIEEWQANARAARASKAKAEAARRPWWDVLPGDYNELTRERDGADADAIAEQHERDRLGY